MKMVIWSDYACPYCYIGEARLKKALAELGLENDVEIEYRAFELDPGASKEVVSDTVSRFARKYGMSADQAMRQIEQISKAGRDEGIDFNYATTQYTNTFDAHRLMKLALSKKDRTLAQKVNERLFDAYFTKNLQLASPEVLLAVGKEAGLPEDEIKQMLESKEFAQEVRADEMAAAQQGVRGVPYFWVEGVFAIPGAISTSQMKDALREAMKVNKSREIKGHVCGPDGCQI